MKKTKKKNIFLSTCSGVCDHCPVYCFNCTFYRDWFHTNHCIHKLNVKDGPIAPNSIEIKKPEEINYNNACIWHMPKESIEKEYIKQNLTNENRFINWLKRTFLVNGGK